MPHDTAYVMSYLSRVPSSMTWMTATEMDSGWWSPRGGERVTNGGNGGEGLCGHGLWWTSEAGQWGITLTYTNFLIVCCPVGPLNNMNLNYMRARVHGFFLMHVIQHCKCIFSLQFS